MNDVSNFSAPLLLSEDSIALRSDCANVQADPEQHFPIWYNITLHNHLYGTLYNKSTTFYGPLFVSKCVCVSSFLSIYVWLSSYSFVSSFLCTREHIRIFIANEVHTLQVKQKEHVLAYINV